MSEARSTAEAYLSATNSSDLRVQAERFSDADRILAAAYSVSGSDRKRLALRVYRLRATGEMSGAYSVAEDMGQLLVKRTTQKRGRASSWEHGVERVVAIDIAMTVLKWQHMPACPACGGRGHPVIEGTPVMDESRECPECRGTGIIPLERLVRPEYVEHARWLASEMDGLSSIVFSDMAEKLRASLDF